MRKTKRGLFYETPCISQYLRRTVKHDVNKMKLGYFCNYFQTKLASVQFSYR